MESQNRNLSIAGDIPMINETWRELCPRITYTRKSETSLGNCLQFQEFSLHFPEDNSARKWLLKFPQLEEVVKHHHHHFLPVFSVCSLPYLDFMKRISREWTVLNLNLNLTPFTCLWKLLQQNSPVNANNTPELFLSYVSNNQCSVCHLCLVHQHTSWQS